MSSAKTIRAVEGAHWRVVKAAMESETGANEEPMKRPTRVEIIETREDVTEYLLDGGVSSTGGDFADGVRQALGWILGITPCPDYREENGSRG